MQAAERLLRRADRQHQRRVWIAFPYAILKKYGDDQAGNLAALIAYYGFLSLFPLMLVLVTSLGMLLRNHPELQVAVQASALANFPVIGEEISSNVHPLRGSGLALGIGLAFSVWAGIGVVKVLQTAMNAVWNVPYRLRPNVWVALLRAMLMLIVLGVITIASAGAGSVGAGSDGWLLGIAGITISVMLNMILFLLAFRILTTENVTWGDVFPGAVVAALGWTILQALGGYIVSHQLQGASDTYGTFAIVIGLLAWIYLGAQMTLFAAEMNVVRKRRLWPRAIAQPPLTDADERALRSYAEQEARRPEEDISVRIDHGRTFPNDKRRD
jgi:YihY family inner membrane protein